MAECCSCFDAFFQKKREGPEAELEGLARAIKMKDVVAAEHVLSKLVCTVELVALLKNCAKSGNANIKTVIGRSVLHEAICQNQFDVARELLQAGAIVEPVVVNLIQSNTSSGAEELAEDLLRRRDMQKNVSFSEDLSFLPMVPLFSALHPSEFPRLAAAFTSRKYQPGDAVIEQGSNGQELYIIKCGRAQVVIEAEGGSREKVATLTGGDYFGEGALLNNKPRNATIEAIDDLEVRVLSRKDFQSLNLWNRLHFKKRKAVCSGDDLPGIDDEAPGGIEKTPNVYKQVKSALLDNVQLGPLVRHMDNASVDRIVSSAHRVEVAKGAEVVKERDLKADHFYVIEAGHFMVIKDGKKVKDLGPGESFGELALLFRAPRAATVRATSEATLWAFRRQDLRVITQAPLKAKLEEFKQILENVSILKQVQDRDQLANALVETIYYAGESIIRQGEPGRSLFILHDGEVSVEKDGVSVKTLRSQSSRAPQSTWGSSLLWSSREVEVFGELSLTTDEPRAASVKATSEKVKVLALDRDVYRSITRFESAPSVKNSNMIEYRLADLETVGLLGCGGFGVVTLVKSPKLDKTFALKALSKGHVVAQKQEMSVMNEKRILRMTNSPFLVRLAATFDSDQHLLFLLEPAMGGELFTVYQRMGFHGKEPHAKFYIGCVLKAFEHLHQRHIIYRDLKPENLLLDSVGYCKVTDFGLAKFVIGHTYTTCGTPDYFAPEMIMGLGHNCAVDWWTLGVLSYELMTADTPFSAQDTIYVFRKVQRGIDSVVFQGNPPWKSLVTTLCHREPSERLPMRPGGVKNVIEHPWFATFAWPSLEARKLPAPYFPKVKSKEDIGNFDAGPEDRPPEIPYESNGTGWDSNFEETYGPVLD